MLLGMLVFESGSVCASFISGWLYVRVFGYVIQARAPMLNIERIHNGTSICTHELHTSAAKKTVSAVSPLKTQTIEENAK